MSLDDGKCQRKGIGVDLQFAGFAELPVGDVEGSFDFELS